ncbi:CaiB/BaiF CoA transferase family protein [Piscinibacter koreensis]|uniref:CoA transferase n=1 Tax=Piscinibacter koreensis TaxID=2742824 RepID=A0A7Y6NQC9_9BURK|nr:CaiB/BaiF CoA-transferase family protein [Schlegelella koreensis]NUZ07422.1 CoA transferase [Schlegelella koreensis]
MGKGPLAGMKVVEFAGIGPGPMCGMLLADLGAEVLRLDRMVASGLGIERAPQFDLLNRGKRTVSLDLKAAEGIAFARRVVAASDALIEGFRPGTMERLGLGPDVCRAGHPKLVYGRVTGFGQKGPLAQAAGHDLNYIALSGALHAIGREGAAPTPPLNLVGDFGGGGLLLAYGMLAALWRVQRGGEGQVVDAAMVDGAAMLMTSMFGLFGAGAHMAERGNNLLDSGAPHYEVYRCADGAFVSVAPIEAKFRSVLFERLGLPADAMDFNDVSRWPENKARLAAIFATRTRAQWCELLEGSDACFAPVLAPQEAHLHAHNRERDTFVEIAGVRQPAPAPRFEGTPAALPRPPHADDAAAFEQLRRWGIDAGEIEALQRSGLLREGGPPQAAKTCSG